MTMACDRFRPLISRYLDDDLSETGIEQLLLHLSGCSSCREELKAFEQMRSWFQVADSYVPLPEPQGEFSLGKLLPGAGQGIVADSGEALAAAQPHSGTRRASAWRNRGLVWVESLGDFFFAAAGPGLWRFALPLLLVAGLGLWWIRGPGRVAEGIDVRELLVSRSPFSPPGAVHDAVDSNLVYLIQHAAEQPMAQYGDEAPMIRQVSFEEGR